MNQFLSVPAGHYTIGTDAAEMDRAIEFWQNRLLENFTRQDIECWFRKEFPSLKIWVEGFEMSRTLVTNANYLRFAAATGAALCESLVEGEPADHPAWGLDISEAKSFCAWMSANDPVYRYRLPKEVEWEAAARGPERLEYPYGPTFDPSKANTVESNIGTTTPVLEYAHAPGPFGHLDLAGNVEEWVDTRYWVYPGGELIKDDLYEVFGANYFILRGGSFHRGGDLSRGARRHGAYPKPDYRFTGFRLVRERRTLPST